VRPRSSSVRKAAGFVPLHRSFSPSSTVAYAALSRTASVAWEAKSAMVAPPLDARLNLLISTLPFLIARRRRKWLRTAGLLPVDHEFWGRSAQVGSVHAPVVIESPIAAIDVGGPESVGAELAVDTVIKATSPAATQKRRRVLTGGAPSQSVMRSFHADREGRSPCHSPGSFERRCY